MKGDVHAISACPCLWHSIHYRDMFVAWRMSAHVKQNTSTALISVSIERAKSARTEQQASYFNLVTNLGCLRSWKDFESSVPLTPSYHTPSTMTKASSHMHSNGRRHLYLLICIFNWLYRQRIPPHPTRKSCFWLLQLRIYGMLRPLVELASTDSNERYGPQAATPFFYAKWRSCNLFTKVARQPWPIYARSHDNCKKSQLQEIARMHHLGHAQRLGMSRCASVLDNARKKSGAPCVSRKHNVLCN